MKFTIIGISLSLLISSCSERTTTEAERTDLLDSDSVHIVHFKDVNWEKLNPARGNQSPQAADLWGNRKKDAATGFIVKFLDGFSSPPHIHNVTYRAIVLNGTIHNDDPNASNMWMEAGSFWTQPAGESHITSAQGKVNMAYVEIDQGPYLVKPVDSTFFNGERPINITPENMVWQRTDHPKAEITYLWGEMNNTYGALIRLLPNFEGSIKHVGNEFKTVIVDGELLYNSRDNTTLLEVGSLFSANQPQQHSVGSNDKSVLVYVRTNGKIEILE